MHCLEYIIIVQITFFSKRKIGNLLQRISLPSFWCRERQELSHLVIRGPPRYPLYVILDEYGLIGIFLHLLMLIQYNHTDPSSLACDDTDLRA